MHLLEKDLSYLGLSVTRFPSFDSNSFTGTLSGERNFQVVSPLENLCSLQFYYREIRLLEE